MSHVEAMGRVPCARSLNRRRGGGWRVDCFRVGGVERGARGAIARLTPTDGGLIIAYAGSNCVDM